MKLDKVLLITNSNSLFVELSRLFQNQIELVTASSKDDVKSFLNSPEFKLVLIDFSPPKGHGYELCGFIRQELRLSSLNVIYLYSGKDVFDAKKARESGATDWLEMPFLAEDHARFKILQRVTMRQAEKYLRPLTNDTVKTIDVMSHRASSLLQHMLMEDIEIKSKTTREAFDKSIMNMWRRQPYSIMLEDSFARRLADKCLDQLPPLIWTETTETIIDRHRCEMDYFGVLEISREYGRIKAGYVPSTVFLATRAPQMTYKGSRSSFEFALGICREEAIQPIEDFLNARSNIPIVIREEALELLKALIPLFLQKFNTVKQPKNLSLESESESCRGWLRLQGTVLGHLVFFVYLANIRRLLKAERVALGMLGTLRADGDVLVIELSDYMERLLEAFWPRSMTATK